jgi:prevent-host-death family protein
MTVTRINSGEARANWREMIDQVYADRSDIIIERNGKDVAVLISVGDYHEIKAELEELRANRRAAQAYAEWQRDATVARPWQAIEGEILGKPAK